VQFTHNLPLLLTLRSCAGRPKVPRFAPHLPAVRCFMQAKRHKKSNASDPAAIYPVLARGMPPLSLPPRRLLPWMFGGIRYDGRRK